MDIKLGREKENKTYHHLRGKEHERQKVIASKQKEGVLVTDVK